jgi:hypothetical protein
LPATPTNSINSSLPFPAAIPIWIQIQIQSAITHPLKEQLGNQKHWPGLLPAPPFSPPPPFFSSFRASSHS